jgi:hypothetical protein
MRVVIYTPVSTANSLSRCTGGSKTRDKVF